MLGVIQNLWRNLLDLVYPPSCVICAELEVCAENPFCCRRCWHRVEQAVIPAGRHWQGETNENAGIQGDYAAWFYRDEMTALIPSMKYHDRPALAGRLGQLAAVRLRTALLTLLPSPAEMAKTALVPVPLHPRRRRERGFNQSLLIAQALGKSWGLRVLPAALRRIRFTSSQVGLSAEQRSRNLAGAFKLGTPLPPTLRSVLVVDDVITTGATVNGCAAVLRLAGIEQVFAIALARASLE
ncbi:ComF family protein [candidate division KSB1 bacterium]|nr:ComF family protein [bacterium]NUM65061.1 ComF family protein [candidate division KSB1 bacterium]